MQINFFLGVPNLGKRQLYAMCVKPFRAYCSVKYYLYLQKTICIYRDLLVLGTVLFKYEWTDGTVSKYCIKSCNQEGEWNSLEIINRSTSQQTQVYEIFACAQIKILNNFLCVEVPPCTQDMHWNNPS